MQTIVLLIGAGLLVFIGVLASRGKRRADGFKKIFDETYRDSIERENKHRFKK